MNKSWLGQSVDHGNAILRNVCHSQRVTLATKLPTQLSLSALLLKVKNMIAGGAAVVPEYMKISVCLVCTRVALIRLNCNYRHDSVIV